MVNPQQTPTTPSSSPQSSEIDMVEDTDLPPALIDLSDDEGSMSWNNGDHGPEDSNIIERPDRLGIINATPNEWEAILTHRHICTTYCLRTPVSDGRLSCNLLYPGDRLHIDEEQTTGHPHVHLLNWSVTTSPRGITDEASVRQSILQIPAIDDVYLLNTDDSDEEDDSSEE
jgi:hypothetical protein